MTKKHMQILVVDDNAQYREALKRMLVLEGFEVREAEDLAAALRCVQAESPDLVVTDLQMGTDREGLDLIEILKHHDPVLPVVMISAVGSFEEGALATQLGAVRVVHKSCIEEELESFLDAIRQSCRDSQQSRELLELIASARRDKTDPAYDEKVVAIKALLTEPDVAPYVKGEAFEFVASLGEQELRHESEVNMQEAVGADRHEAICAAARTSLQERLSELAALHAETRQALTNAEYLYGVQQEREMLDLDRPIAFSYCFAVEREVRARLKGKITRLGSRASNQRILDACIESHGQRINTSFQHELLLATRKLNVRFTIANVLQILRGLIRRGGKYPPDGLKDIGIILLCFGRHYSFSGRDRRVEVENPLKIKGLDEQQILDLAENLIALQYARNPYIHPLGSKMAQLSSLRETAFQCLNGIAPLL